MSDFGANPDPDLDKIRQVAFAYLLAPLDKLKVDQFSTDNGDKVYSFVVKLGGNRLLIRVNPDEIPG